MNRQDQAQQTIADFGEQWTKYRDNESFYGSVELFEDLVHPFLKAADVAGKPVADIGSGTGRIVNMLLNAGASHVVGVEPSEAFFVLRENVVDPGRTELIQATGEKLPARGDRDFVFSFGVLHHIPDPAPVVRAAWGALKPGGRILVWLYGQEGNELYLAVARPLRSVTTRLPHWCLATLTWLLAVPLAAYIAVCRWIPLPMHRYMRSHLAKLTPAQRRLTIYDQLNPAYAKYYTEAEAIRLLADNGFVDVQTHRRHGYSWTVIGTRR